MVFSINGHATGVPKFIAGTDSRNIFEAYFLEQKFQGMPEKSLYSETCGTN